MPDPGVAARPPEAADAAAAPADENETEPLDPFLAERAAAFWREQLGMLVDDEVDPDAQDTVVHVWTHAATLGGVVVGQELRVAGLPA